MDRRQFLILVGGAPAACAVGAACQGCAGSAGGAPPRALPTGPVDAGPLGAFDKEGVYDATAEKGFFVVRRGGEVFAVSATCTHKAYPLEKAGSGLRCAEHGSLFDERGVVTRGPASRPLPRFGVSVDGRGDLIVDPSRVYGRAQWGAAGSSIAV